MDLFTLAIVVGLFFGSVVVDAAYFGDRVRLRIEVPQELANHGFTQFTAEQLFAAEAERIGNINPVIGVENLTMQSRPTILAAIAKPLNLDSLVVAVQNQIGVDIVYINSAIIVDSKSPALAMPMVISLPRQRPVRIDVTQEDGNASALMAKAADAAMEEAAPYRTAIRQYELGLQNQPGAMDRANAIAQRAVSRPWDPYMADQHAVLHNLLALIALLNSDMTTVEAQFRLAEAVPGSADWTRGLIAANRAFIAIAHKEPAKANAYIDVVWSVSRGIESYPPVYARVETLQGLVAWANGNTTEAEKQFKNAIAVVPNSPEAHIYLAQLLAIRGEVAQAEHERALAEEMKMYNIPLTALAQTAFWVDPVHGGLTRRNPFE